MDSETFDTIVRGLGPSLTRRRFGVVAGGGAASLLGLIRPMETAARKRRRKRCKKGQARCGKRCVTGTCCPGEPCGGADCACTKDTDGKTFCVINVARVECAQCPAAGCGTRRCVPESGCGAGVTAICRSACLNGGPVEGPVEL